MQDLRLVLIILGFIAIAALIAHGLWSNKKNQVKPLKDKPLGKVDHKLKDKQGFDLDGIGEKRVVTKSVEPTMNISNVEPAPVAVEKVEPQFSSMNSVAMKSTSIDSRAQDTTHTETMVAASFSATDVEVPVVTEQSVTDDRETNELSYDVVDAVVDNTLAAENQPQNVHHDATQANASISASSDHTSEQSAGNTSDVNSSTPSAQDDAAEEAVFVINIMAREGKNIAGAELLQELSAFGFKFGAMDIFHRHVDAAGKGPVIFSLANMVKPGIFDIDSMEQFKSPGVSLFMMFPCAGQASHNYNLMLGAAERIADGVDGLLMDASRNPLLEDAIEQEQAFIRQLESRALAKKTH
ncbi:MAG: cell division protein ZipA [Moritella sp.]|uniref:cell division protein ZipA n=1 Tax=Moritella sp. TaxID=78556 RepID=UPI0029AC3074|nr:cell division protein ZipA [Moritella sp.]MDX2321721.1 cell division protein ZipA [Moritella sp.]